MRSLAIIAFLLGALGVIAGITSIHTTTSAWEPLAEIASQMHIDPQHWQRHWLGTTIFVFCVGLLFLALAFGLWRRSPMAATAWLISITALAVFYIILYVFRPLPFVFQQASLPEVSVLVILSIASFLVLRWHRRSLTHERNRA